MEGGGVGLPAGLEEVEMKPRQQSSLLRQVSELGCMYLLSIHTQCVYTHTHTHTEEELAEEKQKLYKSIGYSENAAVASYSDEVSTVACVHGVLQTNQVQISFTYTSTLRTK